MNTYASKLSKVDDFEVCTSLKRESVTFTLCCLYGSKCMKSASHHLLISHLGTFNQNSKPKGANFNILHFSHFGQT